MDIYRSGILIDIQLLTPCIRPVYEHILAKERTLVDMRKIILLLIILLYYCNSYSQETRNIYIEIQGLSKERGFPEFRQLIIGLPEVYAVRYCEKLGLAILDVDRDSLTTENKLKFILKKSNYRFYIKNDIPSYLLPEVCRPNVELNKN